MWYQNNYRRHLCDMHIDDWNDAFLSCFSPNEYVKNLKTAKIENAMLYFQSHVGLCYYPTESGVMHRALLGREDVMRQTERLCHQNGMAVTGYYSLNYNTAEHDRHPEWRMLQANGKSRRENEDGSAGDSGLAFASKQLVRYGFCCPNNLEYRNFVYRQIEEMLSYFDVEGMFFDMPFLPHTCYCENCRARWQSETGREFPQTDPEVGSDDHLLLMSKKYEWMGEWIQAVTDCVKKINPSLSVEHNFASAIASNSDNGCGVEVNEACDFVGGDLYGGILNHSLACKFYQNITKNAPFDYMFSRCKPSLRSHTLTKSEDEMLAEILLTTAHHGATMVIDAIDPIGTMDERVYERIGRVFGVEETYEPYLCGKMLEDIGLYYGVKSRFGASKLGFDSKDGCIGASHSLIASHIPFGVTGSFHSLDSYQLLIAPMISDQEDDSERILDYVQKGGALYLSGAKSKRLLQALIGGTIEGYTAEKQVYIAPSIDSKQLFGEFNTNYPLPFDTSAPLWKSVENGDILATITLPYTSPLESRFASIHSDPPGISTAYPAIMEGSYGKGRFIWSALPIEVIDMEEYRSIFLSCLRRLHKAYKPSFYTDAPEDVEITVYEDTDCFYVNAIHLDKRTKMKTVSPFSVSLRCKSTPANVLHLPHKKGILFEYNGEYVRFTTEPMHVFAMYRIQK